MRETTSAAEPVKVALPVKTSLPADWTPDDDTRRRCLKIIGTPERYASSLRRFLTYFAVQHPERKLHDWNMRFVEWVEDDDAKAARTASTAVPPKALRPIL